MAKLRSSTKPQIAMSPNFVPLHKNRHSPRKQMLGQIITVVYSGFATLITAMVPTLIILTYVVIYFIDYKLFKKMFKGYSRPLNGFDVFAYCIFPVLMAIPSIFPKFCRKFSLKHVHSQPSSCFGWYLYPCFCSNHTCLTL